LSALHVGDFFEMTDVAIRVEKLSKLYRLGLKDEKSNTLAGTLLSWVAAPAKNFNALRKLTRFEPSDHSEDILWALKDVTFDVKKGEVLGIIGPNGAGKSTLLKILSRITEPFSGKAEVRGRVGSLLEVGTGFHPELTGRENTYMNGTILGMSKKEIDRKFNEIVDFSGIERFLDTPVKRYSSGMQVRLAFAVAAHLDPEILIVDEVLAVGDAEFQQKCLKKMESVSKSGGKTILFVSHNLGAIRNLCSRAMVLMKGKIVCDDVPSKAIDFLLGGLSSESGQESAERWKFRGGDGRVRVVSARILDKNGVEKFNLISGEDATFEFHYVNNGIKAFDFSVTIFNSSGIGVTCFSTLFTGSKIEGSHEGIVQCTIPKFPFNLGKYTVEIMVFDRSTIYDHLEHNAINFDVPMSVYYPTGATPTSRKAVALMECLWRSRSIE
jgi:lipopolysaccharide transport system ATP-binding protein